MKKSRAAGSLGLGLVLVAGLVLATPASAEKVVTMWSHWPDEVAKRGFVEDRVKEFEASNPECKIKLQFIQKADLYVAAKTEHGRDQSTNCHEPSG